MPTAKMTTKGQITIPAEVRRALNLRPGDKVDFFEVEKGRYGLAARNKSIRDLEGCVPKLDYVPTIEEINEAIAQAGAESGMAGTRRTSRSESDESEGEAA